MASEKAVSFHAKVNQLLDNSSLHEAFTLLKSKIAEQNDPRLQDKLLSLEATYKYMIHYMAEGYSDSGRDSVMSETIEQLHVVNDSIERNRIMVASPDVYSSTRRFEYIRSATLPSRLSAYRTAYSKAKLAEGTDAGSQVAREADEALSELFSHVWTMYGASVGDYRLLADTVRTADFPFEGKAQVISGLLLGNLAYYDANAVSSLIDIYESDIDEKLSARALIAIMLILATHPGRVRNDRQLTARMTLWKDSIITYRRLREVVMSIIRSRDTQRISAKMQNEVLPELMKLRPEILGKLKDITRDSDLEMLDANPEWEELLSKNGLGDKLKELTDMQMDGGDVMMMAFSNLKNYPFFNTVGNWFLPFSLTHSALGASDSDSLGGFSSLLEMEGMMCDSDKYSFALSIARMPEAQRKMMSARMEDQLSQLKDAIADKKLKSSLPEFDGEVTRFSRDIYRFFKLFQKKQEFNDPFARPLDFMNLPVVSEILDDEEILNLVGEFYFKRGYYEEALPILLRQDKENGADPLRWEKIGYCYNSLDNLEQAVAWYRKAELLNPDSEWLIKKMALCNRLLGRLEEANEYYSKALQFSPDNYNLHISAGNCLLESGDVKKALSHFYHADYVKPDKAATFRAIAWGELQNGNYEKSVDYGSRVISFPGATQTDYINLGHACYLSGDLKAAVAYYVKSVGCANASIDKFEAEMIKDADILIKGGRKMEEIRLMIDKVKYDAER